MYEQFPTGPCPFTKFLTAGLCLVEYMNQGQVPI